MLAEIITIGDEILIGQIVDTNSAWMAQKLNDAGIRVKQITSVSDDRTHIQEALRNAQNRAELILITGGLGPTKDDITKKTLTEFFGVGLRRDEEVLTNVKAIFERLKVPLTEINKQQADVPENCTVLQNKNGTAPGMWFSNAGRIFVSMPGVPFEMMYLMEEEVIPRIKSLFKLPVIVHQTILTAGIGESFLSETIAGIEDSLPGHIKLAYLPKLGQVRLRLSGYGPDEAILKQEVAGFAKQIEESAGQYIIALEDKPIEKAVLDFMQVSGLTLAVAESCTGGFISQLITQHSGSSRVYLGGAVTYSNDLKVKMLGVSKDTLEEHGAVSEQTVKEMVAGVLKYYGSDYALAVSGIAGPDGGTEEKPVGTVFIAVASKQNVITGRFKFGTKRAQNIERAAINALSMLFKLLKQEQYA